MSSRFLSTGGGAPQADLGEALTRSLAPDGGLYVPERLEPFSASEIAALLEAPFVEGGARLLARLGLAELEPRELEDLVRGSIDFPLPLRWLDEAGDPALGVLELFHGPTLAFKDVGARFMARLMARLRVTGRLPGGDRQLTVLAATSGDTGSAVAHAFHGLDGFRVVVLFPQGQISPAQQRLFTTLGENVTSLAVEGSFDLCQSLVKRAFADPRLRRRVRLASANSINVGRLLPQTLYYYELCRVLERRRRGAELWVCTPSGNFGNLTAGLYARRLGLPIARLVAATNRNDVVPEFLAGGAFSPRPSVSTPSNAMDVGDPSNFQRIQALYPSDGALRQDLVGARFGDRETLTAMREVYERWGEILDPHAAVGYLGLRRALGERTDATRRPVDGVFLATAHPAKFREVVERAVGTAPPLPPALARCMELPERIVTLSRDGAAQPGGEDPRYEQLCAVLEQGAP